MNELLEKLRINRHPEHYPLETDWDNLGNGWRIHCACGWCTIPAVCLEGAGEDFDDHLVDHDAAPKTRDAKRDPEAGEPAGIDWETIDRNRRNEQGGGGTGA